MRRLVARAAILAVVLPVALGLASGAALAHARLVSSTPAAGATVSTDLLSIRLRFDDVVTLVPHAIVLTDASRRVVQTQAAHVVRARSLEAMLSGPLPADDYTVSWRVLADDGHIESGRFGFSVVASPARDPVRKTAAATRPPSPQQPAWPVAVAIALAVVAGAGAFTVVRRGLRAASAQTAAYPSTADRPPSPVTAASLAEDS